MSSRARSIVLAALVAALVVCAVVQDRVTAAAARAYVGQQRLALAEGRPPAAIGDVMPAAVDRSVRQGLIWSGGVLAVGLGLAASSVKWGQRE